MFDEFDDDRIDEARQAAEACSPNAITVEVDLQQPLTSPLEAGSARAD